MARLLTKTGLEDARRKFDQVARDYEGVLGVALGQKTQGNKRLRTQSVVIFVEKKRPSDQLSEEQLLPGTIPINTGKKVHDVPTDVVELGSLQLLRTAATEVVHPGCSVKPLGANSWGTIGAIVYDHDHWPHILSCAHVLNPGYNSSSAQEIVSPHTRGSVVAKLTKPLRPPSGPVCDAAIAKCLPGVQPSVEIRPGLVIRGAASLSVGMEIRVFGARSSEQRGVIFDYKETFRSKSTGTEFRDVWFADMPVGEGDSGAAVLDGRQHIVGLVFWNESLPGHNEVAWICPIDGIFRELRIDGWTFL